MKRTFVFVLLLAGLVFSACSSKPANHLDAIKQAGTIKVGTSADYPRLNRSIKAAIKWALTSI